MIAGIGLAVFGFAVLVAEAWLAVTGRVWLAVPLMTMTVVTLIIVIRELVA